MAKAAGAHRGGQVRARGRDDPHVYGLRASAAEPTHLPRLDRGQQLDLQAVGQLTDLVEKERAAVGRLEESCLRSPGVREGAALESEQLGLEQGGRNRRAIDVDERARGAPTCPMQKTGDHALAGPRLPEQEHRRQSTGFGDPRQPPYLRSHGVERAAAADQVPGRNPSHHWFASVSLPKSDDDRPIRRARSPRCRQPREIPGV
jgi:hypothetical protein